MTDLSRTTHTASRKVLTDCRGPWPAARILIMVCFAFFNFSQQVLAEEKWSESLGKISVQQGGRVKPFETFSREAILYVTGKTSFQKQSAAEVVWGWIVNPEKWAAQPLIYVGAPQIRAEFGLKIIGKRVSSDVILGEKIFSEKVQDAIHRREKRQTLSFTDKKRIEIYERAIFLGQLAQGDLPGWIPQPQSPQGAWLKFSDFSAAPAGWMRELPQMELELFKKSAEEFAKIFKADNFKTEDARNGALANAAKQFSDTLGAVWNRAGISKDQDLLNKEIFYNRLHAFGRGSKLYLIAALFFLLNIFYGRKRNRDRDYSFFIGIGAYTGALFLHALGFYLRCVISGRAPVTNMYESIVWVSFAVAVLSLPIYFHLRSITVLIISSAVAAAGLLISESFPAVLDPALSPLVPVLRSNLWLTIHVLTITMSYGAFALAWGLGHVVVFGAAFQKKGATEKKENLKILSNAIYRAVQIGVVLLAAGTILGGVWANYSWGRFWGWDPKETWALIALLGYLVVLHGRFIGWFDSFGLALGAVLAFMGVVMAWYGVNFVLAAGLHSYGFGGGGYPYVGTVVLADLALVGFAAWTYKKRSPPSKTKRI